ncbi:transglutaminase-like domain-containing protein [Bradyrhizobium prioriisuperbiae]|uniref:transglutaminase-like domain-containing protein n=1 Tax=Bradyrhizobium prioriisuperbiae TaxID=2854389 RepID=UPI0028E2DAE3|nr:transglutaminase-like domain-containing protein [Bradyrhizobium prioritasuperba]
MRFHRRDVLKAGAAATFAAVLPRTAGANTLFAPQPGAWRHFQITTRLQVTKPEGATQAWVPLPAVNEPDWFQSNGSTWRSNGRGTIKRDAKYGSEMLHVEWASTETAPVVEVTSQIATRDRAIDLAKPGKVAALSPAERKLYLSGTALIPVDGIVKQTSDKILAGTKTDLDKARAIYQWVVENTFRNAATRGCGIGDIAAMLKSGHFGGKCADLNALYVGLARAAGIPARDVYGLRVAPSRFGYKSLGANSETITKAQHCRSEVHLAGFGWVPVDPADVRKVMLEEPPANLPIGDPKVAAARAALFGAWETNWLAYNFAHDLALPGSKGPKLGFLMYPQAETASLRLDCLDPDNFKYTILSKEITAA